MADEFRHPLNAYCAHALKGPENHHWRLGVLDSPYVSDITRILVIQVGCRLQKLACTFHPTSIESKPNHDFCVSAGRRVVNYTGMC
jgi:hypothetical protein